MQVLLLAAVSVDGKIAQRTDQTSLDWTSKEDTKFFVEKTKEVGLVIMGRRTFDTIGKPLKGRHLIVLTRENGGRMGTVADLQDGVVEFTSEAPKELIDRLKQEGHDAVVVAGGSSVYSQFLRDGLVTDLYLTVEPVLFGDGVPFASGVSRTQFVFVESRPLGPQSILLHYQTAS